MDIDLSSFIIPLSFFIFLAVLLKVTRKLKPKSVSTLSFPPGPRKLPLVGNLHIFASSKAPHRILADLALKYGPLMHLQLGEVSTIFVSSPEAAKEVMKTHDINFANRPSLFVSEILSYKNTNIAFAPYGEYWRQLRKICTLELFSARCMPSFKSLREKEISNLCRWVASKQGLEINLSEGVESTTCATFTQASIGKRTNEQDVLSSTIKEAIHLVSGLCIADVYPSIKPFQLIMKGKAERLHGIIDRILENVINDRQVARGECMQQKNLLDVLMKFTEAGHELHLTIDNIKSIILDVLVAGVETSSTVIDWAMAEMMRQPRVLNMAQDEVRQVFNDKGSVDESDFDQLKYLKLVIKETLRIHPPVPFLLPRENYEACKINGYEIPTKTRVLVNAWAIGRDTKYWKEADRFIPERYIDNSVDYKGNNFEYIPFGAGRRICPGMSLGLATVELLLAMFLYHFDWALPDGMEPENVDMTESFGFTARRKSPLHVIPRVKNPLPA